MDELSRPLTFAGLSMPLSAYKQGGDVMSEEAKPLQAPVVNKPKVSGIPSSWQGSVVINLYREKAAECVFKGDIKGYDMSVALRALMRGYKRWKAVQARDKTSLQVNKEN